ncbi:hypothetical protein BZG36_02111 [Bifiguratus adelaidae]|uniref:Carnitine O-acetyltransferase, mitochondrial n=1 Tax=Bifiguratus adelaidae TaxID=1938954 RepID=A0A261Y2Z3_9FUNG|nr:hypothetical protein BZG36_02111 [Bifiguratus adelaidae]
MSRTILHTSALLKGSTRQSARQGYLLKARSAFSTTASRYAAPQPTIKADPNAPPMLRYQKNLPRLPVPALSATLTKYLKTVKPLLSEQEYNETEKCVEEFRAPGGPGELLQKRLEARAADPNCVNWLEEWWNDGAYMAYRDPVVVYVSYFFAYKDDKSRKAPAKRAASVVSAALQFRDQVVNGTLEPEYAKNEPLCMDSYKWMFNAVRLPKSTSDVSEVHDPHKNQHIVVIRNNGFYVLDTVVDGKRLSLSELEIQLQKVIDQAGTKIEPAIGVLTADNRDIWTKNREVLLSASSKNRSLMDKIDSAAFVLCMDNTTPVTREEVSRACWHGDGRNRFFDKPLQFIVFDNGKAGFNGEHSMMDGTATSRLNDYVCSVIAKNKFDNDTAEVRSSLEQPQKLDFEINDTLKDAIKSAEQSFEDLIGKHDLRVLAYNAYGKQLIKKFKTSPDAYAQMVIQLAYYKMFGVSRPTYESGQTRKYQHGRTETCRTVSEDSVAFVKTMEDHQASVQDKIAAFRKAVASHSKYMVEACDGHGVDRHLFGLKNALQPSETKPSIFNDPAYSYSSHWFISSSQLTSEHYDGYGWGEVVPDGFGIAYMIKNNSLHFNVASIKDLTIDGKQCKNGTERMKAYLEEAADELRAVLETEVAVESKL